MQTYTPGYAKSKVAVCLFGVLIASAGFWQFFPALQAVIFGESTYATVISVSKIRPGAKEVVYSTTEPVPTEENRNASFHYNVEFSDSSGALHLTSLNVITKLNPSYHVGDSVKIFHLPQDNLRVYAVYDLSTWVAGALFALFGLLLALALAKLRYHANQPINLPPDTPYFPGAIDGPEK